MQRSSAEELRVRASEFTAKKDLVLRMIGTAHEAPTVRELATTFGVAPATMHSWLSKMADEELVVWESGRHRSLRCTRQGTQRLSLLVARSA